MSGGNRHTGVTGETDRDCGSHLCRHPLSIGHAFLTDFLTNSGRHATPANHRTAAQSQSNSHDNPDGCVLNGAQHVGFQFLQQSLIVAAYARQFHDFIGGIRDAQHNATQLATLLNA